MLQKNQQLGHYRIVRLIGRGGMGEVYLADDLKITRQVAIKVVQSEVSLFGDVKAQEEAARLFQREMRAITMLDHPFILMLLEVGEETQDQTTLTYMVMPYRPEGSLPQWLRQQNKRYPLPVPVVAHFISQAADALQHAHDKQIIHLDVKPSNFLVRERGDRPGLPDILLADFGIAKITSSTRSSIKGGNTSSHGTLEYTAPEQWNGTPVAASDQYALAIMAYELLAGSLPFQGNMAQMIYQQIHVMPDAPSRFNAALNPAVDAVLFRALAKTPEGRFLSIADFGHAFQHAASYSDLRTTLTLSSTEATTGLNRNMFLPGKRQITVTIPPGVREGQVIRVEHEGEAYYEGGPRGVLQLSIAVKDGSGNTHPFSPIAPPPPRMETPPHIPPPPPVKEKRPVEPEPLAKTFPVFGELHKDHTPQIDKETAQAPTVEANRVSRSATGVTTSEGKPSSSTRTIILTVLALVIILASIFGFASYQNHINQLNASATASANLATSQADDATATAQVNATATSQAADATATAQANANATATVVAATATVVSANPYPSYLPGSGTLAFVDPLSSAYKWSSGSNPSFGGNCQFTGGAYHVNQSKSNARYRCDSNADSFSNFGFEVKMTIIIGDCGGINFRDDGTVGKEYIFTLCQNGNYSLSKYSNDSGSTATTLVSGTASNMNTGLNQVNTIAVVANGSTLELYVNEQRIIGVNDGSYAQGYIGLTAYDATNVTEIAYSNARLWTL